MNNTLFSNSFLFNMFSFHQYHYTDNRRGSPSHYIAYMRSGHARIVTENYTVEIQQGDVFYIPYGIPYQSYWYGNDKICFDSYAFHYFPELEEKEYPVQVVTHDGEILSLINRLNQSHRRTCCTTVGTLYLLLGLLLPHMKSNPSSRSKQVIAQAEDYLYQHPDAGNRELAEHCGLSESGLYSAFHHFGSLTPNELRQKILTSKAEELLTTTDLSVETISNMLNFSSTSYFRKVLKKHTGLTPREIRKKRLI